MLRNIWKVRDLLFTLVRRDMIVRYQSSFLGFFWSFAKPLALVAIFGVAFQYILKIEMPNDQVPFGLHLLVGILAWSFFARCIGEGQGAILGQANLIKKVKIPVEVFPAATAIGNLINYLLGMLVVFPVILVMMAPHPNYSLANVPALVALFLLVTILLTFLAFAITLIVSALNVFFRDVESLMEVLLQAWFYGTPIVYPFSLVSGKGIFETLIWLNPMTPICLAYRRILLYRPPMMEGPSDGQLFFWLAIASIETLVLYLIGRTIFLACARHFADEI
ncbi:MAG: ABC transporter permease [Candidatus Sumerlaeia bacterium]